jgi:hypothetical protein
MKFRSYPDWLAVVESREVKMDPVAITTRLFHMYGIFTSVWRLTDGSIGWKGGISHYGVITDQTQDIYWDVQGSGFRKILGKCIRQTMTIATNKLRSIVADSCITIIFPLISRILGERTELSVLTTRTWIRILSMEDELLTCVSKTLVDLQESAPPAPPAQQLIQPKGDVNIDWLEIIELMITTDFTHAVPIIKNYWLICIWELIRSVRMIAYSCLLPSCAIMEPILNKHLAALYTIQDPTTPVLPPMHAESMLKAALTMLPHDVALIVLDYVAPFHHHSLIDVLIALYGDPS